MHQRIANGLTVICIAILCSGCTSYTSQPTIDEHAGAGKAEIISSYSYEMDTPLKVSRFGKDTYAATQKAIPDAKDVSARPTNSPPPTLEIKVSEFPFGGACGQEYFTGLSFGLIPSWCTRENLFKFDFTLNSDHGFCRKKTYSIGSKSFAHLILVPFALFEAENRPLTIYQTALKDFLQESQCTTI
ncbi:hypothetical protein CT157_12915 [Pseudomonas syringae]|jgi:hypothetical protein|uniref:Uncharacterized protein n=1 Tax=Pseudomonas syringae TaxID=317 RepID=A0A3T0JTT0_PSESX|nr:hypothetical protein CT157_12915 [Pseudomonas syringae]